MFPGESLCRLFRYSSSGTQTHGCEHRKEEGIEKGGEELRKRGGTREREKIIVTEISQFAIVPELLPSSAAARVEEGGS